jgi:hypothetical protein
MKTVYKRTTFAVLTTIGSSFLIADPVEDYLDSTFSKLEETIPGKFNLDTRLRYESFDLNTPTGNLPDGQSADRDGSSLRVRYGYTTPDFNGFTAMAEGETVTRLGGDSYDIHPLDDSGDGTDLNQLWIQYKNAEYGHVKIGRQIYALDDQRFIGSVGWRQNIQTYDAATAEYSNIEKLSIKPFYIAAQSSVNGIYNKLDTYGLNTAYAFNEGFKLTGFFYDLRSDEKANKNASNQTIGVRAMGHFMVKELPFTYAGSIASQENSGPSSLDYEAQYFAADISTKVEGFTFGGGFEIMESGFRTPLATVHKFNGYADALLPLAGFTNGLEDFYIYTGYTIPLGNGIKTKVIYHWFDSESGGSSGQNGGSEIDLVASYQVNKYFSVIAKYGDYNSDGGVGAGASQGEFDKKMFTLDLNFKY